MNLLNRVLGHLRTIIIHKFYVGIYCCRVGLIVQGMLHDMSKFSKEEMIAGIKYYNGKCSPNSIQKSIEGYSTAWIHHKNRNKHHSEYWLDYSENAFIEKAEKMTPIEMPIRYLVEMFFDRVAACKVYKGKTYKDSDPLNYYDKQKDRLLLHPNTRSELEKLLNCLAIEGEEKAICYAKKLLSLGSL